MFSREKRCQSCSMPLSKDKNGGGTEANGDKSTLYCSYCYQNGAFTDPDITLDAMKRKLEIVMKRMKTNPLIIKKVLWGLPRLQRWRERVR